MGIVTRRSRPDNLSSGRRPFSSRRQTMSSTNNGTIRLKTFADLAEHLDLDSLPPGPPDTDDANTSGGLSSADDNGSRNTVSTSESSTPTSPAPAVQPAAPQDLAGLIARLAGLSSSLETAARED